MEHNGIRPDAQNTRSRQRATLAAFYPELIIWFLLEVVSLLIWLPLAE